MIVLEMFFKLLCGHALCDFPLQSEFMAKGKDWHNSVGVPWYYILTAHALVHGGCVLLITGSLWAGVFELAAHWFIDWCKCDRRTDIHMDQALHVLCKAFITGWLLAGF